MEQIKLVDGRCTCDVKANFLAYVGLEFLAVDVAENRPFVDGVPRTIGLLNLQFESLALAATMVGIINRKLDTVERRSRS